MINYRNQFQFKYWNIVICMKIAENIQMAKVIQRNILSHKLELLECFSQSPSVVWLPATEPNNTAINRRSKAFSLDIVPESKLGQFQKPNVATCSRQWLKQTITTLAKKTMKKGKRYSLANWVILISLKVCPSL